MVSLKILSRTRDIELFEWISEMDVFLTFVIAIRMKRQHVELKYQILNIKSHKFSDILIYFLISNIKIKNTKLQDKNF